VTKHILDLIFIHMRTLEYVSGKKKVKIPWAKVTATPADWMDDECYPSEFQWADPSKIRIKDAYDLLDHWRQRKEAGLAPIIWNPSCDILANVERPSRSLRNSERPRSNGDSPTGSNENFAKELDAIREQDEESRPSPSPPLSPLPAQRTSGANEPCESRDISPTIRRPIVDHSCESGSLFMHWSFCGCHI